MYVVNLQKLAIALWWVSDAVQAQVFTGDFFPKETMRTRINFLPESTTAGITNRFHGNPAVTTNGFVSDKPAAVKR